MMSVSSVENLRVQDLNDPQLQDALQAVHSQMIRLQVQVERLEAEQRRRRSVGALSIMRWGALKAERSAEVQR